MPVWHDLEIVLMGDSGAAPTDSEHFAGRIRPMPDEPPDWFTPDQIRASAWKMFEKSAQLREQADELVKGARRLLEIVGDEQPPADVAVPSQAD